MAGDYDLLRNRSGAWQWPTSAWWGVQTNVKQNGHAFGCMCPFCNPISGGTTTVISDYAPLPSRLGWICSRCKRSLSPDVTVCACETCGE